MTHAMVFTGFGTNSEGTPVKFRVENSWGESRGGDKGELEIKIYWIFMLILIECRIFGHDY